MPSEQTGPSETRVISASRQALAIDREYQSYRSLSDLST